MQYFGENLTIDNTMAIHKLASHENICMDASFNDDLTRIYHHIEYYDLDLIGFHPFCFQV